MNTNERLTTLEDAVLAYSNGDSALSENAIEALSRIIQQKSAKLQHYASRIGDGTKDNFHDTISLCHKLTVEIADLHRTLQALKILIGVSGFQLVDGRKD